MIQQLYMIAGIGGVLLSALAAGALASAGELTLASDYAIDLVMAVLVSAGFLVFAWRRSRGREDHEYVLVLAIVAWLVVGWVA